ncbi:FtsX-like permease family protein [Corynebacterium mastitidis]|uniref:FtsX-like permease family protein n=1 Tax=Corynebacterium mastitidis TaxID=161890 RepID=UPI00254FDD4B|nr:FtsX-like permease family protein [Corynebacterium mastitidis]MDK8449480.1 FtsX-like permease family protein [Corynebacterium mastitidis]
MSTTRLVWDLHTASLRARTGTGTVSLLAVFSLTVSSTIAFLVAGGTWMFYQRARHPEDASAHVQEQLGQYGPLLNMWFFYALIACAFILPALFSLISQSAVLGASGRERRLALLRLLGLSSRDITRMTTVETGLQAVLGIGLGLCLSFLLAPAFTSLEFQERRIALSEILLPWWGYLAVVGILLALALSASFFGMRRVRVTPLGVARRTMPPALKRWRFFAFLAVFLVGTLALRRIDPTTSEAGALLAIAGFLFLIVSAINLAAPYLLQIGARCAALLPGTAHLVACRRISGDSRDSWRRSSAIAFFGFLSGYLVLSPIGNDEISRLYEEEEGFSLIFQDVTTGAMLTLLFGFIITGTAIFLGQASEVFESAELSRSFQLLGVPRRFFTAVAFIEIMLPIMLVSLFGFACGSSLCLATFQASSEVDMLGRVLSALAVLGAGWLLTALAILAAEPLRSRTLATHQRKND